MGGHSIGIIPMAISLCASFNSAYMILGTILRLLDCRFQTKKPRLLREFKCDDKNILM
jgi:ABC-type polysaccharide/polyol phosphate transport system ATPase subunit